LRWLVELVRVDNMVKVSHLSSFLVAPCIGHFEAALSIFAYLQKHRDLEMFFDPCEFDVDKSVFPPQNSGKNYMGILWRMCHLTSQCCLVNQCILQHMLTQITPAIE
jgi:hypothetical protein